MKNCDSMATRGRMSRVIIHFIHSFVPARSTSSSRHIRTRARATGSSTRRANERSALEMSTADASSGERASNSRASSNDDDSGGVSAAFALALSVVSSVSLVIVNKHLISALGFREGA